MKQAISLILIIFIGLVFVSCDTTENDKDDLILMITPQEQIISVDEEITFQIKVENVQNLSGVSMELVFNGGIVTLPDDFFSSGSVWGEDAFATTIGEIDRLNVAIGFLQGTNASISGDEILFDFKLKGIAEGETNILIHNLNLIDAEGEDVIDFDSIFIENTTLTVQ